MPPFVRKLHGLTAAVIFLALSAGFAAGTPLSPAPLPSGSVPAERTVPESTLRVWGMGAEAEFLAPLARAFEAENPGVRIRVQALSWGGSYEKLVTAFLGGAPPDVCQLGTTMMKDFQAMGALENLDSLYGPRQGAAALQDGPSLDPRDFYEGSLSTCLIDGRYYGVPWYIDTRIVFYRKELLEKYGLAVFPQTWEGLVDLGIRAVADRRASGDARGYFLSLHGFTFEMYYWQAGGEFRPLKAGSPAFDAGPMSMALDLSRKYKKMGFYGDGHESGLDYITEFARGWYDAAVSGPWMAADILKSGPLLEGKYGLATLPWGPVSNTSFIGGSNLVQFTESRHKDLGRRFISFLSRPEVQGDFYRISGDIPSNRRTMELPGFGDDPIISVFRAQLESVKYPPADPEWGIFWDRFWREYEAFMESDIDSGVFAARMNDVMDDVVRESERTRAPMIPTAVWILLCALPLAMALMYVTGVFTRVLAPARRNSDSGSAADAKERGDSAAQMERRGPAPRKPGRDAALLRRALPFILPGLLVLLLFRLLPLSVAFVAGLTDLGARSITDPSKAHFLGMGNYLRLYQDEVFWKSIRNTAVYLLFGVPMNMGISLVLALVINSFRGWTRNLLAVGFFIPSVVTTVASAVTWKWLYSQQSPVNALINALGLGPIGWLSDPAWALPSLILFAVWKGFGLNMLIILAGLQLIPPDLYEAVRIDGGNRWHEFRHVTLPGLRRTLFVVFVGAVVTNIQFFIEPYVLTGGGPKDSTLSLMLFSYNRAFGSFQLGYASAVINFLFVLFCLFNAWQSRARARLSE